MKYLFIAFLFISSFTYSQGIEPSSFQPTPYLGGVLRGVTPFVDEFTGQTYYLYVHDSLDAAVPYVDTIFMTDFNLYYIKNGDTIYVGSVTDSSFIYNVVSDTFALDMDIDSTNELQELFHEDNILVLTGAGPDSQVDLTPYMDVDSIYMENYNLWYTKSGETGTPRFVGNVTDTSLIRTIVHDSLLTVTHPPDSTLVGDTPMLDLTLTGKTITGVPDTITYLGTKYNLSLKENYITPGTTSQYWRGDKTWQTTPTGTVTGSGTATRVAFWDGTSSLSSNSNLYWDNTNNRLGINTTTPTHPLSILSSNSSDGGLFQSWAYSAAPSNYNLTMKQTVTGGVVRYNFEMENNSTSYPNMFVFDRGNVGFGVTSPAYRIDTDSDIQVNGARVGLGGGSQATSIAFGNSALAANTSGTLNVALGQGALASANLSLNTAIGWYAQNARTSGANNLAIGSQSMRYANTGSSNVAIGSASLSNITGSENVAVGTASGALMTSADYNVLIGMDAGAALTTGDNNTYVGRYAGGYNTTGSGNIAIGHFAAYLSNTSNRLSMDNTFTTSPIIGGQLDNNRVGINTDLESITDALHVTGNIRGTAAYIDATNSPGTSGQVLSSTVTGTDWIDLPAGDITAVTVSAPITGGGTSGSVNIAVDTTDATSAALATQFDLLGKQATLVSGTNIKTVNSNSLVGSGDVSVGTVQSITVNAPLTTTQAPITTTATLGVDTTATTGSALATQFDISSKVSGSGTDNYIPRFNGTTAIENSIMYDDGTMIGIGNTSPSRTLHVTGEARITDLTTDITPTVIIGADVNGVLESLSLSNLSISGGTTLKGTGFRVNGTGSFNSGDLNLAYATGANPTTYPTWTYSAGDFTFRLPYATSGQVLKFDGTGWAAGTDTGGTYAYWRLSANDGTPYAVTDDALIDFENSTGITWTRSGGEMTATLADNSATNEIQSLSYNTGTRALGISSGSGVTLPLVTSSIPGLVSAYPNNTTSFLRGDGNWATPPTPSVTGTAPILVTSGNISLNYGTGLANSGGQLVTYNPTGSIYSSSDTSPETFDTSYEIVNMGNSAVSPGTDISYGTNNISITSASAAGRYQISYNCCHDVAANNTITYSIFIEGSEMSPNPSKIEIETQNGIRNCVSKTFLTTLANGDTVDLRLKLTGMVTGNAYGNANLTIIKI